MDNLDEIRAETLRQEKERADYLSSDGIFKMPGYDPYQLLKVYTCDMGGYSETFDGACSIAYLLVS